MSLTLDLISRLDHLVLSGQPGVRWIGCPEYEYALNMRSVPDCFASVHETLYGVAIIRVLQIFLHPVSRACVDSSVSVILIDINIIQHNK